LSLEDIGDTSWNGALAVFLDRLAYLRWALPRPIVSTNRQQLLDTKLAMGPQAMHLFSSFRVPPTIQSICSRGECILATTVNQHVPHPESINMIVCLFAASLYGQF
jgi:hypothetical protein